MLEFEHPLWDAIIFGGLLIVFVLGAWIHDTFFWKPASHEQIQTNVVIIHYSNNVPVETNYINLTK